LKASTELDADLLRLSSLAAESRRHGDDSNYLLRRGALLHTDVAMFVPSPTEPIAGSGAAAPQRFRLTISDGLEMNMGQVAVHWELARMLLEYVQPEGAGRPAPGRDDMVRQWYRATAAWMQSREDHDTQHLDRARLLFPDDPDILFLSGCQHETYAAPHIQSAMRSAVLPTGMTSDVGSDRAELRQAEAFFRRAIATNPNLPEARLRLGRALSLLDRHADARVMLTQALAGTDDPWLLYFGGLFLGRAEEALGNRDAARASYERAADLYPHAQSPRLALSQLARRSGDRAGALSAIAPVFSRTAGEDEREDPWWSYHVAQGRNAGALLDKVREPFLRHQ
jgi:tetratricopeptide (TPR) repeat protein